MAKDIEEKKFHVKKLENPDFSDLKYQGKKLMMYWKGASSGFPIEIYIGEVILGLKSPYLKSFSLVNVVAEHPKNLEKHTILGRKYWPHDPFISDALGEDINKYCVFYQFQEEINIDEIRDFVEEGNKITIKEA